MSDRDVRRPCPSCPWRRDQDAQAIPGFRLELAEALAATSPDDRGFGPDLGAPMFACHQSRDGDEVVCAGWLAVHGAAHPSVRLAVLRGDLVPEQLAPGEGWPALEASYQDVIAKLRRTTG